MQMYNNWARISNQLEALTNLANAEGRMNDIVESKLQNIETELRESERGAGAKFQAITIDAELENYIMNKVMQQHEMKAELNKLKDMLDDLPSQEEHNAIGHGIIRRMKRSHFRIHNSYGSGFMLKKKYRL